MTLKKPGLSKWWNSTQAISADAAQPYPAMALVRAVIGLRQRGCSPAETAAEVRKILAAGGAEAVKAGLSRFKPLDAADVAVEKEFKAGEGMVPSERSLAVLSEVGAFERAARDGLLSQLRKTDYSTTGVCPPEVLDAVAAAVTPVHTLNILTPHVPEGRPRKKAPARAAVDNF
jgi:hypothetical protein